MSEQKMPALPINDDTGMYYRLCCWNRATVECIQREAYEACDRQWRERLEPLRVAVEAILKYDGMANDDDASDVDMMLRYADAIHAAHAARTLLETDR